MDAPHLRVTMTMQTMQSGGHWQSLTSWCLDFCMSLLFFCSFTTLVTSEVPFLGKALTPSFSTFCFTLGCCCCCFRVSAPFGEGWPGAALLGCGWAGPLLWEATCFGGGWDPLTWAPGDLYCWGPVGFIPACWPGPRCCWLAEPGGPGDPIGCGTGAGGSPKAPDIALCVWQVRHSHSFFWNRTEMFHVTIHVESIALISEAMKK